MTDRDKSFIAALVLSFAMVVGFISAVHISQNLNRPCEVEIEEIKVECSFEIQAEKMVVRP